MSAENHNPILSYEGNPVSSTPPATITSNEQDPLSVVSSAGGYPVSQSVNTVAPATLAKSSLPMNLPLPENLGSAGDSDGAAVASRKGTIMRPNPQSTTAR